MGNSQYQTFRQRYKTIIFIANGAYGNVYKVQDTHQNIIKAEKVSIKPIKPSDRQKFIEQANLLINLNHPNIIKGYEYIIQQQLDKMDKAKKNQYIHIIMQYIEGKELKQYLGKLTQQQVINIYKQIKSAILYLQKYKIVHRDISLDNILVDQNMKVKITDFGIASELKQMNYYETDIRKGKQSYRAPEVWNFRVSMNSDLWGLGIIVLELYFGGEIRKVYGSKPGEKEEFPSDFYQRNKQKIPEEIMKIVEPLLQRDYTKRKFYDGDQQEEDTLIVFEHIKTDKKITKNMTQLWLNNSKIATEGAVEIANNLKKLTKLNLVHNNIEPEGAVMIAKNLKKLTVLQLCYNNIGTEGTVQIAKNLKNLTRLDLCNNNIEAKGAFEIAINLINLTWLSLNRNKIGTEGTVIIAKNLKNLTVLHLYDNNVQTEAAFEIAKNLSNLTTLQLNSNKIETKGAVEIVNNLKHLTALFLQNNNIDENGKREIRTLMKDRTISL